MHATPIQERPSVPNGTDALRKRMREVISDPNCPMLTAAVGIVKDGQILFSEAVGSKQLGDSLADADTKFRIASISKLVTAIGAWQLIEQGLIDPDADISGYLGFSLRNPAYPDVPITVKMIMSHTSSIRDGGIPGSYNIPWGQDISRFFTPGSPCHIPGCWAPAGEAPGVYFAYCNMNYCLLGSVIEAVSGKRFDRYMTDHVFVPMGLTCSYNIYEIPDPIRSRVGTLYRKLNASGVQDPINGVWTAQCDDFSGGWPRADFTGYIPGTNGSLFGPMGSLRISIRELCRIMLMFCRDGRWGDVQILRPETLERMFTPLWTYDPLLQNGDNYGGLMNCYGMGPHIFTNTAKGDRLVPWQDLPFAGHTAEAYGLVGGMAFDRSKGNGIVYYTAGMGADMSASAGRYSAFYRWEEMLLTAAAEAACFPY